jgi:hypothetical protein
MVCPIHDVMQQKYPPKKKRRREEIFSFGRDLNLNGPPSPYRVEDARKHAYGFGAAAFALLACQAEPP